MVGLGNPGAEFAGSLHNAGSDAVELLARQHGASLRAEKGTHARAGVVTLGAHRVALAVPSTYMNESGLRRARAWPSGSGSRIRRPS